MLRELSWSLAVRRHALSLRAQEHSTSVCLRVCVSVRSVCLAGWLSVVEIAAWRPMHAVTELYMHVSTSQLFGTCAPGCRTSFNTREAGEWKPGAAVSYFAI